MKGQNLYAKLLPIIFAALFYPTVIYATQPITIENFAKYPRSRNVKISPDGKHLSVIFRRNGEDLLAILDRATKTPIKMVGARGTGKGIGQVYWANNKRLVYNVTKSYSWSKAAQNHGELFGVNIDGTQHKGILGYSSGLKQTGSNIKKKKADYGNHEIIDLLKEDEKHIMIVFYPWKVEGRYWVYNDRAEPTVYRLNVYTGKKYKISSLPLPGSTAVLDNDGNVRFAIGVNDNNDNVITYKASADSEWEDFSLENFEGKNIYPHSFTSDNQSIYLSANVGEGTRALYLVNLKDNKTEKIFHDQSVDMSLFIRDFSGRKIVAVANELALPQYNYLDNKDKKAKLHKKLMKAFNGLDVNIPSATNDGSHAVVQVYSDTNAGDYYIFDTQNLKADYLLSKRTWIDPEQMAITDSVKFKTRDNEEIYGYLTKPQGKNKSLPLVVMPHGGPHGVRDYWGFNSEVQLLANQGYAVLQVNYRGSGGFGKAFEEIGHGKWGTLMQDDITDATKSIIEQGIADPKRVCIYGASYGAYAALMGVIREPTLYQCAIGSAGVYNLPMMFEEGDIADVKRGIAFLKEALGENPEDLKKRSPVFNVDKIQANVLLIHGAKDERAPIEQVESLREAFDKINKKYDYLELYNEGHGYAGESNRIKIFTELLGFLKQNIGN